MWGRDCMEYRVNIDKKTLLRIKPLRKEYRKELFKLWDIIKEFIKYIGIIIIVILVLIVFLETKIKISLGMVLTIYFIFSAVAMFFGAAITLIFIQIVSIRKMYISKFSYLINDFRVLINNRILIFEANNLTAKIELTKCTLSKYEEILILTDDDGFRLLVPINKIKDGKMLEKEIIGGLNG